MEKINANESMYFSRKLMHYCNKSLKILINEILQYINKNNDNALACINPKVCLLYMHYSYVENRYYIGCGILS